jgi:hypothetical protein
MDEHILAYYSLRLDAYEAVSGEPCGYHYAHIAEYYLALWWRYVPVTETVSLVEYAD